MSHNSKYVTLNEENFDSEVLKNDQPVLVDFWAEWCGPCRAIAPTIEKLAGEFDGKATIAKVNVEEQPGLAERFSIRSIPSLLFFRDGEIVDQLTGVVPQAVLADKLESLLQAA